ncbi:uncharacterized protein Rpp21 [Drosophila tropicalis]|uniref:uncharacterized protein Rpp21 n=1 Tax=Drosophila tropicalis TaxID=46794 RepID=UPI0035AC14DC
MAESHHNILAAYYGKLCRNVGTKAQIHIAPAVKRTLCRRCSLPLIPGVNTTLQMEKQRREPKRKVEESEESTLKEKSKKPRRHRPRRRKGSTKLIATDHQKVATDDTYGSLQLQCHLCRSQRRFVMDTRQPKECWIEHEEAIDLAVTLDKEKQPQQEQK